MPGLCSNTAYVIMNAGANEISKGAIGLVYLYVVTKVMVTKGKVPSDWSICTR